MSNGFGFGMLLRRSSRRYSRIVLFRAFASKAKAKPKQTEAISSPAPKKYSSTVLLPKTLFPLRVADGEARQALDESLRMSSGAAELYQRLRTLRRDRPEFILHDGPPYANGDLHIGHAVNKILKDITNRYKILKGFQLDFRPGWDCHGLPIELKALERLGIKDAKKAPTEMREKAKEVVKESSDLQRDGFKRWGVLADWEGRSNSYFTTDRQYEAKQIELFWRLYQKGLIYRDLKPVHWSPSSQTSLAEAELEYNEAHKSTSVYVAFPLLTKPDSISGRLSWEEQKLPWYAVIWTTTPWSIPGNQAIAFNPNVTYAVTVSESPEKPGIFLMGDAFVDRFAELSGLKLKKRDTFRGEALTSFSYSHPLYQDRVSAFLPGTHVTAEKGSGLVHTAPAHGHDDYLLGRAHNLDTSTCLVDENGNYTVDAGSEFYGKSVFSDGVSSVLWELNSRGLLLHRNDEFIHSYPYDWRTKKPVITRASDQWFIDVEKIKPLALEALEEVQIMPEIGKTYMKKQLLQRPYWCISRQRLWGVPIPVFYDINDTSLISEGSINHVKNMVREEGADVWWNNDESVLLPREIRASFGINAEENVKKGTDILDIWFESGTSWAAVVGEHRTADLYLEGHDQYAAWFQTSLITSIALRGKAPFKKIFVHGFALDEQGRKMSKSIGNVVHPDSVVKYQGADALRLWVAHFAVGSPSILFGPNALATVSQNLLKWRSMFRFLLGVLHGYSEAKHQIPYDSLLITDKYMLQETRKFVTAIDKLYESMEYDRVVLDAVVFFNTTLSSFFCNVIKDRIYCDGKDSLRRRSAQTTARKVLDGLLFVVGPVVPYLTEEVFAHVPGRNDGIASFFEGESRTFDLGDAFSSSFLDVDRIMQSALRIRDAFHASRAELNTAKCRLIISATDELMTDLGRLSSPADPPGCSEICDILGVADVRLQPLEADGGKVHVEPSGAADEDRKTFSLREESVTDSRCGRCRKYVVESERGELCSRCLDVIGTNWAV